LTQEHEPRRQQHDAAGFAALHRAAYRGDTRHVLRWIARGAPPDLRTTHPGGFGGATPLHLAVAAGHAGVVEALLASGASPAATDDAGYTPLHLAAERGDLPIVRLLLLARAEVEVFIGETTPLDLARRGRHGQVAGLLRQMGAR
jgi:ankyrin repeat protein